MLYKCILYIYGDLDLQILVSRHMSNIKLIIFSSHRLTFLGISFESWTWNIEKNISNFRKTFLNITAIRRVSEDS